MSENQTMPRHARAAILVETGKPLVIDQIELPSELQCGQVLVKLLYTGICGAQINEIDAAKGPDKFLPHLLGHEGSGEVIAVGPAVTVVKPGQKVVLHWRKGNGIQCQPPQYMWRGKQVNAGWVTTFNDYAVISENRLTPVPDGTDLELAPLFGCAVTTALGVINNEAKVRVGESVVILGAGGVGLNLVQGACMVSASPVVAVDLVESKLDLARKLGATHAIKGGTASLKQELQAVLGSGGADVIVDNTGLPEMIELAYELTGKNGRVICVGVPKKGNNISIYSLPLHFGKLLTGTEGGQTFPSEDIPRYLKLVEHGLLDLQPVVTDRFEFDEINTAISKMRVGKIAGRCIVRLG